MATPFIPGGPERYEHQKRCLKGIIRRNGICALLCDPGTGKSAITIDYMSVLAMKSPTREVRVLVACPLVAIDTWVDQMAKWASPQVNYWAESLGGSIRQKAEALASRGPQGSKLQTGRSKNHHPRAAHHGLSVAWGARGDADKDPQPQQGPDGLGDGKPRIVLEVVNLDMFSRRDTVGSKTLADIVLDSVKRFRPDLMVIDECHKIKGESSNISRLLGRIGPHVKRRLILTGTVTPASPLDVFAQWRFLEPYAFGEVQRDGTVAKATFGHFRNRYARMGGFMGRQVVAFQNLDEMQAIMAKNAEVAKKEQCLDLPATQEIVIPVHLSPAERKAYEEMKKNLVAELGDGSTVTAGSQLTKMLRLRQITAGHIGNTDGTPKIIGDSKVQTIRSLVNDTLEGEKRVVVFAYFRPEIEMLAKALAQKGTEVQVITGETSPEERMAYRNRFGSDDPTRIVMVAQVKTMSVAVNELITAKHAVFATLSPQRDDLIQAKDRLDRIGQQQSSTFWYALAPGTVDEVIKASHDDRTNLEQALLKHVQETSQGGAG